MTLESGQTENIQIRIFKKVKKLISHCIFKSCSANGRGLFQRYHMGVLEFLVPFYPINTAWVVFSSDLKMDLLNVYSNIAGSRQYRLLDRQHKQGLFCHLYHSHYCVAASARNLLHLYMTPGTTSLEQTQPYILNHLSLGHNRGALSVGGQDQNKYGNGAS